MCPQFPESARVEEQDRISNFVLTPEYRELENLNRTLSVRFEDFPDAKNHAASPRDPRVEGENEFRIQPQDFEDRIIFLSMYNDIDWATKNNASICENLQKSPITPRSFPWVSGLS